MINISLPIPMDTLQEVINIVADILITELKAKKTKLRKWVRDWLPKRKIFATSATFLNKVAFEDKETNII